MNPEAGLVRVLVRVCVFVVCRCVRVALRLFSFSASMFCEDDTS